MERQQTPQLTELKARQVPKGRVFMAIISAAFLQKSTHLHELRGYKSSADGDKEHPQERVTSDAHLKHSLHLRCSFKTFLNRTDHFPRKSSHLLYLLSSRRHLLVPIHLTFVLLHLKQLCFQTGDLNMDKFQVKTKPGLTIKCITTPRVLLVLLLRHKPHVGRKEQEGVCMASSSSSLILLLLRRKEPSGLKPEKDGILLHKSSETTQAHGENSKLPHIVVLPQHGGPRDTPV